MNVRTLWAVLVLALLLGVFFGCDSSLEKGSNELRRHTSYRDIPGVTEEEIADIEAIRQSVDYIAYGASPTTEMFLDIQTGEIRGYSALFCEWMTELFDIEFRPTFYLWVDLLAGLESGEIGFTGELTPTEDRRENYFMTDTIVMRLIKTYRIRNTPAIEVIKKIRPVRYIFFEGTTTMEDVVPHLDDDDEIIILTNYEEAFQMLSDGEADVIVDENIAESTFDEFSDEIVVADLNPLIYSPVSLTTQTPEFSSIISVVNKALQTEDIYYLTGLYEQGYNDYLKNKLYSRLTPEEREYIANHSKIRFAAEYENYPMSFYNTREKEWQGIVLDVLDKVEDFTGLSFELVNGTTTEWSEILEMLDNHEISFVSELTWTPDREGNYLWPSTILLTDKYALVSKLEHPNITINEVLYVKVAIPKNTAYEEIFESWFPNHRNTVLYEGSGDVFDALSRGEVDMIVSSMYKLLSLTNYREETGYKANIIFDYDVESTLGFNINETMLCSIVDKALSMMDTVDVVEQWTRKTYDYRVKLAKLQIPLISSASALIVVVLFLILFFYRNRNESKRLNKLVQLRTSELELETAANGVLLDSNPFNSVIVDADSNVIDVNLTARNFFQLHDEATIKTDFLAMLNLIVPEYQPHGQKSVPVETRLKNAFENGYEEFDTSLVVFEKWLYFNVKMKRLRYKKQDVVAVYMFDMTMQKEIQFKLEYQNRLQEALGNAANLLLTADAKDLDETLHGTLELLGKATSSDRAYVWKNQLGEDGRLYSSQIVEWSPNAVPQQGKELATDVALDESMPDWRETLLKGISKNLIVKNGVPEEVAHLLPQGIVSLLLVPIFMQNNFWGFIGLDDCQNERTFSDSEENFLKICGFMVMAICDAIQNEVSRHLLEEREEALISAQIKTNFLANMSHEIRTPMNAILGMIELIMHENISDTVASYSNDIRSACRGLLTIINDILDISKIEAGKMKITLANYHVSSLLADVISIIKMRAEKKMLIFAVNIDTNIPNELFGDELRIKQILINLLNNAVKFTNEGQITLSVSSRIEKDGLCQLNFSVEDTGIGIKQDDVDRIFVMFQQMDTKKNRNVEGTGLGLSISKQLVEMMDGYIDVQSEYGIGSKFTVSIPQSVANSQPLTALTHPEQVSVLVYENRAAYLNSLIFTLDSLGCNYKICANRSEIYQYLDDFKYNYIFISSLYMEKIYAIATEKQPRAVIVVLDGDGEISYNNVLTISMPIHCLQIANILNDEYDRYDNKNNASYASGSIFAPEAKVLVVDDNAVNLKVAAGLLNISKIKADTASNGMRAVEMVRDKDYDLVFMDHMMPDMDGVDTTIAIRSLGGKYTQLPIVALTANAVGGVREMFKAEGLDDFLAKPIEISKLNAILKKWLPEDKQKLHTEIEVLEASYFEIRGLNTRIGITNSGGTSDAYNEILAIYVADCENRLNDLEKYHKNGDLRALTICVHAIKGASANIGAVEISTMAAALEAAGRSSDTAHIDASLPSFCDSLSSLLGNIREYLNSIRKDGAVQDKPADPDFLKSSLAEITTYMNNFDLDMAETTLMKLYTYQWDEAIFELIYKIKEYIDIFDYDAIETTVAEIKTMSGFE